MEYWQRKGLIPYEKDELSAIYPKANLSKRHLEDKIIRIY